jgi:hypothetical protein
MHSSLQQHELELLALSVASAVVYYQLIGTTAAIRSAADIAEVLDRVAHAISNVAPIYTSGPRQLSSKEILQSTFRRGATVLKHRSGNECGDLTIRRKDMRAALGILKAAGVRFASPV